MQWNTINNMPLVFVFSNNYNIPVHDIDFVLGNKIQEIRRKPQKVMVNSDIALIKVIMWPLLYLYEQLLLYLDGFLFDILITIFTDGQANHCHEYSSTDWISH